jgi:hypothetical protein
MGKDGLKMARQIIDPRWGNEEKTHIIAGFKYDDGRIITASITNTGDAVANPDWQEIMETIGAEKVDENTAKASAEHEQRRQIKIDNQVQELDRRKKEAIFNAKAEAFDIELVKSSKNRQIKNKIRRASSVMEVMIYATLLHMLEDPIVNPVEDTSANTASANT